MRCVVSLFFLLLFLYLSCQPVVSLEGGVSFTFLTEGVHTVTVQASLGSTVLQDKGTVIVYGAY